MSSFSTFKRPLYIPLLSLVACFSYCYYTFTGLDTLTAISSLSWTHAVFILFAVTTSQQAFTWFIVPLLQRLFGGDSGSSKYRITGCWKLLKCFLYLGVGLGIVAMTPTNPSLAVLISVPLIPILILCRPYKSFGMLCLQSLLLFILSPPVILVIFGIFKGGLKQAVSLLNSSLENYETFGNLLLPVICLFYWPIILSLQLLATMES